MSEERKDAPKVIMLPPTLLLLHIMAGIILSWIFPFSIGHAWGWLGLILISASLGITHWSKTLFKNAGTNVAPNKPSVTIVKDGPYRYSRNPMYVCFILVFVALALLADAPMMLLVTLPLWYLLDQRVIVPEEEYLEDKFGDDYRDYKAQVRRWI